MQIISTDLRYEGGELSMMFDAVCMKSWSLFESKQSLVSDLVGALLDEIKDVKETDMPLIRSLRDIAGEADESGVENAYHNPHHTAIVTMMAAYFYKQRGDYNQENYLLLLCAAAGHDLKHPGKPNPEGEPIYNEAVSADRVCEIMDFYGVNKARQAAARGLIVSTSTDGPHDFLRHLTHYKFNEQAVIGTSRDYTNMARILCDADVFARSGVNMEVSQEMSRRLTEEAKAAGQDIDFTTPQSRAYFMDHIVGRDGFMSQIARELANENFHHIRQTTESEMKLVAKG